MYHLKLQRSLGRFTVVFSPSPVSVSKEDICENVSQTHYNIGAKPVGFSLTKMKIMHINVTET